MNAPTQVEPSISVTAFSCPHCGALTKQSWWVLAGTEMDKDQVPFVVARDKSNVDLAPFKGTDQLAPMQAWVDKMSTGTPHLDADRQTKHYTLQLNNVFASQCYNCDKASVWIYDRMVWPVRGNAPTPNPDLPADIRADYDEAATIADLSPRGAAAMLRLAVQKLCAQLGGDGKNINDDIAKLVSNGLDKRVQQALDVVRVIGNNAVHPGQIDLKDDRATVGKLFSLLNLIAEIMISQPKHVAAMFDGLPDNAKNAIEARDKRDGSNE